MTLERDRRPDWIEHLREDTIARPYHDSVRLSQR